MTYITHLLCVLDSVKTYHWQTTSYARHKATDALYKILAEKIDEFVEVQSGENGVRPTFDETDTISLKNISDEEAKTFLQKFADWIAKDLKDVANDSIALNHLIEEMSSAVNQALYLFTFV